MAKVQIAGESDGVDQVVQVVIISQQIFIYELEQKDGDDDDDDSGDDDDDDDDTRDMRPCAPLPHINYRLNSLDQASGWPVGILGGRVAGGSRESRPSPPHHHAAAWPVPLPPKQPPARSSIPLLWTLGSRQQPVKESEPVTPKLELLDELLNSSVLDNKKFMEQRTARALPPVGRFGAWAILAQSPFVLGHKIQWFNVPQILEIEKSRVHSSCYDNYPCLSAFSSSNFFTFIVVLVLSHDSTPSNQLTQNSNTPRTLILVRTHDPKSSVRHKQDCYQLTKSPPEDQSVLVGWSRSNLKRVRRLSSSPFFNVS
ncbi:hypothetical protein PAAG_08461 [Paracoccidioides lutzii Pb01]|uniref:Uncharacterized protein n=1 Tax=Paracoccidioides lutzii (strain ATCC MYA-826 / Pb01) TaxID=502779 RepID=C1HCH0_PARBA|nr:hypothetical protein PAAG_08461 [Paracoccidioides lutzii Pb01]EEH38734.2 hypothetical protein PAAG_08461 [Paracoccidioides lutzii Pb01]